MLNCRKSDLFHNGEAWINKSSNGDFDIPYRSFDVTEVSELMGLFILNKINQIVHADSHGIYRDGGLIIAPGNRKANERIL